MKQPWEVELEEVLGEGREKLSLTKSLGISLEEIEQSGKYARISNNAKGLRTGFPGQTLMLDVGQQIRLGGYKAGYKAAKSMISAGQSYSSVISKLIGPSLDRVAGPLPRQSYVHGNPSNMNSLLDEFIGTFLDRQLPINKPVQQLPERLPRSRYEPRHQQNNLSESPTHKLVDPYWEKDRLPAVGYYVGVADALIGLDAGIEGVLGIYKKAGVLDTKHVCGKLKRYSDLGGRYRNELVTALHKHGVV
ncbi:MAG: hypothetical protein J4431_04885 [Candidatus Aenigmarchaeota archaeon]|nr:hypothetical protein [Candidatus Aenigmarchaeota archaeon]